MSEGGFRLAGLLSSAAPLLLFSITRAFSGHPSEGQGLSRKEKK